MYEELIKALRDRADTLYNASRLYDSDAKDAAIVYKAADAIEKLQKQVEDYECRLEISPEAEYAIDKHCDDIISRMDKLIKGLDGKPRWISVEERLPEKYEQVLTYGKYGFLVDNYIGEFDGNRLFAMATHRITHWMPLPKPLKEET